MGAYEVVLDRENDVEHTSSVEPHPTLGLDETTWTTGMSFALPFFKVDLAYLYDLAQARTNDVFGKRNVSLIGTLNFDYERLFSKR